MTVVLGKILRQKEPEQNTAYIQAIPRFLYRYGYEPLQNGMTTDKNWGCCIRCGQGMLYQFISKYASTLTDNGASLFNLKTGNLLELFYDRKSAPFGIHNICQEIIKIGGKPGEWVKASVFAHVMKALLQKFSINVIIAEYGTILRSQIESALSTGNPILLLFPLMLGFSEFDVQYLPFIQASLSISPRSIGIIAGQQGKAYYLVGYCKTDLKYFDPHETLPAFLDESGIKTLSVMPLRTIPANEINSSLLVGLFIKSVEGVDDLCAIAGGAACPIQIVDSMQKTVSVDDDGWDVIQ